MIYSWGEGNLLLDPLSKSWSIVFLNILFLSSPVVCPKNNPIYSHNIVLSLKNALRVPMFQGLGTLHKKLKRNKTRGNASTSHKFSHHPCWEIKSRQRTKGPCAGFQSYIVLQAEPAGLSQRGFKRSWGSEVWLRLGHREQDVRWTEVVWFPVAVPASPLQWVHSSFLSKSRKFYALHNFFLTSV